MTLGKPLFPMPLESAFSFLQMQTEARGRADYELDSLIGLH